MRAALKASMGGRMAAREEVRHGHICFPTTAATVEERQQLPLPVSKC